MTKRKEEETTTETATAPVYAREQILQSKKLDHSPDILRVVLRPGQRYSLAEVAQLVKDFKERVI